MDKPSVAINDWACGKIREMILNGEYEPGDKLNVLALAKKLEVSQTPIKEALNRLVSDGLVENIFHRGYIVRVLSVQDMKDNLQIRQMIELFAAKLAVENVSKHPDLLESMQKNNQDICKTGITREERVQIEQQFHETLVALSENNRLLELYRNNWCVGISFYAYTSRKLPLTRDDDAFREHVAIVEGLKTHCPEMIEQALTSHFVSTYQFLSNEIKKSDNNRLLTEVFQ